MFGFYEQIRTFANERSDFVEFGHLFAMQASPAFFVFLSAGSRNLRSVPEISL